MSHLIIPDRITLPLSIIISILIFGLTKYYEGEKEQRITNSNDTQQIEETGKSSISNFIFIVTYVFLLVILVNSSYGEPPGLFITWEKITPIQILNIIAAIAFSFFLPGYALVTILNKKYKLKLLLKLLLAYIFSILIAGLGGYISGSFGYVISDTTAYFIGSYVLIFLFYLQQVNAVRRGLYPAITYPYRKSSAKIWNSLLNNYPQFIVFSSLLALVIVFTYHLNDGEIVIDQWYHHGRALSISSGLFKEIGPSDLYIPPFFPSLLAAFFNLSGSPSVNAFVAINFLNIVPVFAFYYFFTNWIPKNKQRAALLASALFMLSSGFGWLYAINIAESDYNQITFDVSSSINILGEAYLKTFDIETPTNFMNVGHPDATTGLIIIALPTGFTLLGMIKEVKLCGINNGDDKTSSRSKSRYFRMLTRIAIITAVSFLGILSHDEFFLFIIVASVAMVILFRQLPKDASYSIFFVSFLFAITLVILVDIFISPAGFYSARHILGPTLVFIVFLIVCFNWTLYVIFRKIKFLNIFNNNRIKRQIKIRTLSAKIKSITTLNLSGHQIRFFKLLLGMVIVLIVAYLYLITLLVWNELSVKDISSQIKEFSNVPWYLLPVKFGLTGLLGLAFILSYLFKKFEKEIFIFGIIIIIAFLAGPYYDEHRFGKYIMTGMAAFAALFIYQILSSRRIGLDLRLRPLIVGIILGVVVTASCLSIFMFAGWVELFTGKNDLIEGGRRDFPETSEIELLNFLNDKIIHTKAHNIALPEKETTNGRGFVTKIYGFSPTSRVILLQSPLTLNSSTMEGLYNLLNHTEVRYIILPKKDIFVDTEKEGIISSANHSYRDNISSVMRFVLDNFPRAYEDQNYIILEVLPFTPPFTKESNVAFVYQNDSVYMLPRVSNNITILPMDFGLFGSKSVDNNTKNNLNFYKDTVITDSNDSKEGHRELSSTYSLILGDKVSKNDSKSITLWSDPIQQIQEQNALNSSENNRTMINYIEGNFRIIDDLPEQSKSEKRYADNYGAGIVWEQGNSTYLASIIDVGLELSKSPTKITLSTNESGQVDDTSYIKQVLSKSILSQNEQVKRQKGIWYNLKILFLQNNVEIYVNDILRMKVPLKGFSNISSDQTNFANYISRIGVNSYFSKSEFRPIILGQILNTTDYTYPLYQKIYYQHYYPLNTLALSKIKYEAYQDGDLSAFSKKYVVLSSDKTPHEKNEADKYFEYVSKGGNLIVINADDNFDGTFSKLLLIKPGNLNKFNNIGANNSFGEKNYSINVSGTSRDIEISSDSNLTIKSYYATKGQSDGYRYAAPFVIEKNYGKGKIIFVNAKGYFDSLLAKTTLAGINTFGIKNQYFTTLAKVAAIIGIPSDDPFIHKNSPPHPPAQFSTPKIIGDIKIYPKQNIVINSSYLQFQDSNSESKKLSSYNLTASDVSISAGHSEQISLTNHRLSVNNNMNNQTNHDVKPVQKMTGNKAEPNVYDFRDVTIKDLKLYGGPFEILINVTNNTRSLYLPTSSSHNDYIGMSIPRGFDMTIRLLAGNSTYAQVDMIKKNDKNSFQRINVSGYNNFSGSSDSTGDLLFHNVKADIKAIRQISAIMKGPEIKIMGDNKSGEILKPENEETRSIKYYLDSPNSTPVEIQRGSGDIKIKIVQVDNYDKNYQDWTKRRFVTYLNNDIQLSLDDERVNPVKEQNLFGKLMAKAKIPGDISEYAKEHGIEVPWRDAIGSTAGIVISLTLMAVFVIAVTLTWSKITRLNKLK